MTPRSPNPAHRSRALDLGFTLGLAAFGAAGPALASSAVQPVFIDRARDAGVTVVNRCGNSDRLFIPESNGCGAAWLDYDGDGDVDLYVVNGNGLEPIDGGARVRYVRDAGNRLYRNDGSWRFADVTEPAGAGDHGWGNGCTVGDIDADGDPDLYVANLGPDVLYVNDRGVFADLTAERGLERAGWSASAVFGDPDLDGDLDFFVAGYVDFDPDAPPAGGEPLMIDGVAVMYGPEAENPGVNVGAANTFFVNDGTGHFAEATAEHGLALERPLCSYGAVFCDVDVDGRPDLLVTNDAQPNNLFMNTGDGCFREEGEERGFARGADGSCQAGMGIAVADVDDDGDPDLFVTNFDTEPNNLYINDGSGRFQDMGAEAGVHEPSMPVLGWSCAFFDVELDGDLDLFYVNGHVYPDGPAIGLSPWELRNHVLLGTGGTGAVPRFVEAEAGRALSAVRSSRGMALADVDDDGDLDAVVVDMDGPPQLLENRTPRRGHWISVRAVGRASGPDSYGATVRVTAGGRTRTAWVLPLTGLYGAHDPRVHVGLGPVEIVDRLEVRWPSGALAVRENVAVDQPITIIEPDPPGRGSES